MFTKLLANMKRWKVIKFILAALSFSTLIGIVTVQLPHTTTREDDSSKFSEDSLLSDEIRKSSTVTIGIVTCSGRFNVTSSIATYETLTLVKSVIISASLYRVRGIDFHIFVDTYELQLFLNKIISEFSFSKIGSTVNVKTYFHNVFKSVPLGRAGEFLKTNPPCTNVRLFFPNVLSHLNNLLYLDTDIIVLGNIGKVWERFLKLGPEKLVALAPNNEPEDVNFEDLDFLQFGDIPHVPPKGVNAGVFYMNLAGLRKFGWTEKLMEIYKEYTNANIWINDQRLVNIFLHQHPEILEILPCHYNFQYVHCERGLTCKGAYGDPTGIQMLHGTGDSFYRDKLSHRHFFASYTNFDFGAPLDIIEDLLKPLKERYLQVKNSSTCNGVLGQMLFKDVLKN